MRSYIVKGNGRVVELEQALTAEREQRDHRRVVMGYPRRERSDDYCEQLENSGLYETPAGYEIPERVLRVLRNRALTA